ncbi:IPExxxVDY family protein [uncultured Cyclobacterium sp.]|uniref:IPExxxVDY family protein n=1 Tax=uncultured Cyclobacterium sp. TaxID=453820 RepID=UPI0030EDD03A|tara:strand:- start:467 stop:895 length:429 start_codon:yes stop_codon:yes gene_type:complete
MKKSKLLFETTFDFDLLGLVAPLKDYKLAWLINTTLGIRLKKTEDYHLEFLNQPDLIISQFMLKKEHGFIQLLKNKSYPVGGRSRYLIPELLSMDYFLLCQDFTDEVDLNTYIDALSNVSGIHSIVKIDTIKLKSKENLLTY